jgi:hypothetical protein
LHSTDIITFRKDGTIVANTGGWQTVTTKARLNEYLPVGIYQRGGLWYWEGGEPFTEGDTIRDGKVVAQRQDDKADKKLRKAVAAYAKLYHAPLPPPGPGDCWHCHLQSQNGETMGDAFKDKEHLLSHIKEGYVVPSLAYHALKEAGNSDLVIAGAFHQNSFATAIANERLPRHVARYVRRRLGLAK